MAHLEQINEELRIRLVDSDQKADSHDQIDSAHE